MGEERVDPMKLMIKSEMPDAPSNINTNQSTDGMIITTDYHGYPMKSEPMDPMPPLASPATVVVDQNSGAVNGVVTSNSDKNCELEPSPPATVISLAPAQPYPPGTTQLTFATPAYDIGTVADIGRSNGQTVYLATDYITYCDYYPAASTATAVTTTDQYQTVRQHLSAAPANVTYTQASDTPGETSFLDRYLRQQQTNGNINGNNTYKTTTLDLASPDSGIGEATTTPRGENGNLPQVSLHVELFN